LQLTELDGQRVELSMSVHFKVAQLFVLILHALVQGIDFSDRTTAGTGDCQRDTGAEHGQCQHRGRSYTQDTPAQSLVCEVQCFGHLPCA
jgi:hypothetical protein